jgi:hypothetical protein
MRDRKTSYLSCGLRIVVWCTGVDDEDTALLAFLGDGEAVVVVVGAGDVFEDGNTHVAYY